MDDRREPHRLDTPVEQDVFASRAEALRYGARLVVREEPGHRETSLELLNDSPPGRVGGGSLGAGE